MKTSNVVRAILAVIICGALLNSVSLPLPGYTPDPPPGGGGGGSCGGSGGGGSSGGGGGSGGDGGGGSGGGGGGGGGDCNLPAGCPCNTPLSDEEWNFVRPLFTRLVRTNTCKEAPADGRYNCLAWCIGDTSQWWWYEADTSPKDGKITVEEMTAFLNSKGVAPNTIIYYGFSTAHIRHVAKKCSGVGVSCSASSKLGAYIWMWHDPGELEGGYYGNIVGGN